MAHERLQDQTIALAGLTQTSCLITHLALTGKAAEDSVQTMLAALFQTRPKSAGGVFGGVDGVSMGLAALARLLRVPPRHAQDQWSCIRYMLDMITLSNQLAKHPDMLDVLGSRLPGIESQWARRDEPPEEIYTQVDQLYRDTLSHLPRKIRISGQRDHITRPAVVHRIRSLLLSGVRAAVLWRQLGGRRHALLLRRRQMIRLAEQLS